MLRYLESELPQGSQEWLDLRKGHITATMASVIAGNNPFQSPDKLWKEMLGLIPRQESNFAMNTGKRLEPVARNLYEQRVGEQFDPLCIISETEVDVDGKPWIMASLDGMDAFATKGIEIKCPGEKTHLLALSGTAPDYYGDQMQWQFLASENKFASIDYVSYNPKFPESERLVVINVLPDFQRQQELLSMAKTFRQCLKDKVPPCGSEFQAAAKLFVIANKEAEIANLKLEEAKKLVISAAGNKSQNGSGVIVSVSDRKGTVSNDEVLKALVAEFNIPEYRIIELKALHTGPSKQVTSVKAANDANKVYEAALKERKDAFSNIIYDVSNSADAQAEVSHVSPIW